MKTKICKKLLKCYTIEGLANVLMLQPNKYESPKLTTI
jgi:hypothetical protein